MHYMILAAIAALYMTSAGATSLNHNQDLRQGHLILVQNRTPSGACGGIADDVELGKTCCFKDSRPYCDTQGHCSCEYDKYCSDTCKFDNTCEQRLCGDD